MRRWICLTGPVRLESWASMPVRDRPIPRFAPGLRLLHALAAIGLVLGLIVGVGLLTGCGGSSEAQVWHERATAAESLVHVVLAGAMVIGLIAFLGGIILGVRSRRDAEGRSR
jgi:hypothetical protein